MLVATPTRFLFRRRTFALHPHAHCRVGCDRWRLHWGLVIELIHSIDVQFYHDFFVMYVPFSLLSFVLFIFMYNFSMLLSFDVCLSIYYIRS